MTVSPRRDGTGVPVGWFAVPKFGQKNALPRGDATEMPVGVVAVLRTASRVGLRIVLRDRSKINLMPVEDRLWDGSWWRNRDPASQPNPAWPSNPACNKKRMTFRVILVERKTRLELATPTLARSCSTN